jgi:broad specificity phosphatase PhoE
MSPPTLIMIIRHGEKPIEKHEPPFGVTADGEPDWESLTARGWQRAGALATLLAPSAGQAQGPLRKPNVIYASKPRDAGVADAASKSKRPQQTVTPLADRLALDINLRFGKGEEADLAAEVRQQSGIVLISWQHEKIAEIAQQLMPDPGTAAKLPGTAWPEERYDLVWVLTPPAQGGKWTLKQVPQLLLVGDKDTVLT